MGFEVQHLSRSHWNALTAGPGAILTVNCVLTPRGLVVHVYGVLVWTPFLFYCYCSVLLQQFHGDLKNSFLIKKLVHVVVVILFLFSVN